MAIYFDNPPKKGTVEADRFDVLSDVIEAYESRAFDVADQEPKALLKNFMEMTGGIGGGDRFPVAGIRDPQSQAGFDGRDDLPAA